MKSNVIGIFSVSIIVLVFYGTGRSQSYNTPNGGTVVKTWTVTSPWRPCPSLTFPRNVEYKSRSTYWIYKGGKLKRIYEASVTEFRNLNDWEVSVKINMVTVQNGKKQNVTDGETLSAKQVMTSRTSTSTLSAAPILISCFVVRQ